MNLKNIFFPLYPIEHDGYSWGKRQNFFKRLKISINEVFFGTNHWYKIITITNCAKHFLFVLYNIIFFPIIGILYLNNVRFIHVSSWQIGSYIHQIDTIIKNNILNKNYKLIHLAPKFICSNNFLKQIYSKHIIVIENLFLYLILLPFIHSNFISIEPWDYETQNKNSIFNRVHNSYFKKKKKFSLELNEIKNKFSKSHKKTVCIHIRDKFYKNSNTDRNVDIHSLKKTIIFLLKAKYKVVRFINKNSPKLKIYNDNYQEMLVENETDKINQYILIKNCDLVIGSQSGVLNYNLITNTPFLLTNAIPINNIMVIKSSDMYIFKKIKRINGKYLTLNDIIKHKFHLHPEKIKKGFKIIANTENEILDSTKEILKIKNFKTDKKILKSYSDILNKISSKYTNAKISKSFLNKNKRILI